MSTKNLKTLCKNEKKENEPTNIEPLLLAYTVALIFTWISMKEDLVEVDQMYEVVVVSRFKRRAKYLSHMKLECSPNRGDASRVSSVNDSFFWDSNQQWNQSQSSEDPTCFSNPIDGDGGSQVILDGTMRSVSSISALKELCMAEGFDLDYKGSPPTFS